MARWKLRREAILIYIPNDISFVPPSLFVHLGRLVHPLLLHSIHLEELVDGGNHVRGV